MIGGWVDARSGEAEEEVRNMFHAAGVSNTLDAISGPSGRTNFLRASLLFPKEATLPQKCQLQKEVLDKLKNLKCSSGIEGQNGVTLWVQRDRPLEERLRIPSPGAHKKFLHQHSCAGRKAPPVPSRNRLARPGICWANPLAPMHG